MRIALLTTGSTALSRGVLVRDLLLARALMRRGHTVKIVPLLEPVPEELAGDMAIEPVFFEATRIWAQQRLPRILQRPGPLSILSSRLGPRGLLKPEATPPRQLAPYLISLLNGRGGRQREEFDRLLAHLQSLGPLDIVQLGSAFFSGLAPALRQQMSVGLVCLLQREEEFAETTGNPHLAEIRTLVRRNGRDIDALVTNGQEHARRSIEFYGVAPGRVRAVAPGIDPAPFSPAPERPRDPLVVGALAPIQADMGLDLLVEAVARLARLGMPVRLKLAGRLASPGHWQIIERLVTTCQLQHSFEYVGEVTEVRKPAFYRSLSVFCRPSRISERRGFSMLEAMAAGVPVVASACGIQCDLLQESGAGMLFPPEDHGALADQLRRIWDRPDEADEMGRKGTAVVGGGFHIDTSATDLEEIYEQVKGGRLRSANTTAFLRRGQAQ